MTTFSISGRYFAAPPPPDWREQLTLRLGAKPRRIGSWAELGLYGALGCMADAGETTLPQDTMLMLASRRGTYTATDLVLGQMRDDLPMPLAFLQTQPSQVLALIAARLNWQGHACFFADTEMLTLLRLAAAQAGAGGVLLGWVDEMEGGSSNWLRLRPDAAAGINSGNPLEPNPSQPPLNRGGVDPALPLLRGSWRRFGSNEKSGINFVPATSNNEIFSPAVSHLRITAAHLLLGHAGIGA